VALNLNDQLKMGDPTRFGPLAVEGGIQ
jgi:hypothetical protein